MLNRSLKGIKRVVRNKYLISGISATLAAGLVYKHTQIDKQTDEYQKIEVTINNSNEDDTRPETLNSIDQNIQDNQKQADNGEQADNDGILDQLKEHIKIIRTGRLLYLKNKLDTDCRERLSELDSENNDLSQTAIIALPLQLPEEYIDKLATFLNAFSKSNEKYSFKYTFIDSKADFDQLETLTGTKFIENGENFNIVGIHHGYLNKIVGFKLSDIVYDPQRVIRLFTKISRISTKESFKRLIEDLKTDELIIAVDPKNDKLDKFYEYVFQNDGIRATKIKPVILSKEAFDISSDNSFITLHKPDINNGDGLIVHTVGDMANKSVKDINGQLAASLNNHYTFNNAYVVSDPKKYKIIVAFDKNLFKKSSIARIKEVFKRVMDQYPDLKESFEITLLNRKIGNSERHKIKVFAFDTKKHNDRMYFKYENKDKTAFLERYEKEPELFDALSLEYHLGDESLSVDNLTKFLGDVKHGRIEFGYKSQLPPIIQKYSRRISSENFTEHIRENKKHQALFYYSKNCSSCKKFLPLYEKMALENIKEGDGSLEFNRINNDENNVKGGPIYPSTPRIVVYHAGFKNRPFEYRSNVLTEQLLRDFIYNSLSFELIDYATFEEKLKNYIEFKDMGFEFIN